jgi:hypothetical protein
VVRHFGTEVPQACQGFGFTWAVMWLIVIFIDSVLIIFYFDIKGGGGHFGY